MKKLLALLMALVLTLSLAACGGNETPETTTNPDEVTDAVDATTAGDVADDTTAAEDDTTAAEGDTTVAEGDTTAVDATTDANATTVAGETTAAASSDMTAAEFAAFFNAETAKIAKSGKYSYNRVCSYTKNIDLGSSLATNAINSVITAIDKNSSLDTVVGDFLGIGTKKGTLPKDDVDSDYKVKAASLKPADLGSFKASNGTYTFTLANATNPKKTGATPFSRFTNDFITHEEVVDGIAGFTTAIKVNSTTVNYKNIKVTVTVANGKITSIKYAYAFDAQLALKVGFAINGSGAATTNATFSAINY